MGSSHLKLETLLLCHPDPQWRCPSPSEKQSPTHLNSKPSAGLVQFSSVQSLSRVQLFTTPWTAARQASLSITISWSPPKSPLSQWCHPTIPSSVVPLSSCPQSFPASGSFQMSQLFTSGGQSTEVSTSTSVLPMNTQDWSPLGWTGWISLQSKGLQESSPTPQFLTFQVPMQYCTLQHWTLLLSPVPSTTECCFWFGFILSGVISPLISSSILGTYRPGELIFQYPILLPFHTAHGVLKARILKWFAIPFSSGPHSVRPLDHDPSVLGGPTQHGLVSLT